MAPTSYYAAKKRQTAPSARAIRDVLMMQLLLASWIANRKVYGAQSSGRPLGALVTTSAVTRSPA